MAVNARIIFSSVFSDLTEYDKNLLFTGIGGVTFTNLKRHFVKMVVNVAWEIPNPNIEASSETGLIYRKFYIREDFFFRIENLDEIVDTIHSGMQLNQGPVLIYCMCGMSRSSTIILAYAMKYLNKTLKEAFAQLQAVRPYARPNPSFFYQLTEYEKTIYGKNSVEMVWEGLADSDLFRVLNNGKVRSHKTLSKSTASIYVLLPNIYRTDYMHLFKSEVIDATQSGDMTSTVGSEKVETYMENLLTGNFSVESVHSKATINDFLKSRYIVYSRSEAKPLMLEPLDYNKTMVEIEIARKDLISKRKSRKKKFSFLTLKSTTRRPKSSRRM